MDILTLIVAIPAALLCLILRPIYALCVYLVVLFGYSQWVTLPIGTIDFTTGRIGALFLLFNVLIRSGGRMPFRWRSMDTWLVLAYFCAMISLLQTMEAAMVIERQSGWMFDTLIAYFVLRATLKTPNDLVILIKGLLVIGLPLALMGAYESVTGVNPMNFLVKAYNNGYHDVPDEMRHGFYRASVTMGVHIIFGLFFAGVVPLVLGLWHYQALSKFSLIAGVGVLLLGLASSLSSAPYLALIIAIGFLCCTPMLRFWPVLLTIFLVGTLFVEVYSNRHFYEVLTGFAFDTGTASYRVELMNECFGGGMRDHWFFGFGYVGLGPGNVNTNFHWEHYDLCNIYLAKLVRTGLLGVIPYLVVNYLSYRALYLAYQRASLFADRWMIWCCTATLLGWNVSMLTCSAMNQVETLLYMLTAVTCNLPEMVSQSNPEPDPQLVWRLRYLWLCQLRARLEARHG